MASVEMRGPFFTRDPAKTFRQNVRTLMLEVANEGAKRVIARLRAGEDKRRPLSIGGRVADLVEGRTHSLRGKAWLVTAVVSVNTAGRTAAEATAILAGAARIESREHPFRRVTSEIRSSRAANLSELLKGIDG